MSNYPFKRIAVLGAGSWGTALAILLHGKGHDVRLWARRPELAESISENRRNETYLPAAFVDPKIVVSADIEAASSDAEIWLFAVPSQSMREVAKRVRHLDGAGRIVISVAKGIENGTLLTPTRILREVLPSVDPDHVTVVSGPSHAEELALGLPTTVVAASRKESVAHVVQAVMMTEVLRVYTNTDVVGVEISAAVKNVMAIAAGISDGVGYGDNAKAAIMTRGIAEITRLGVAMGARQETFGGLSGIGDLVVTCVSRHSRNRHVGEQIGKGRSLDEVEKEMSMVAEGVRTTLSTIALARHKGVDMPITQAVYEILFKGKKPLDAVKDLMSRRAKTEHWLPVTGTEFSTGRHDS